jgi:septal ring factor EnvC (AmiA/AmiB activator)
MSLPVVNISVNTARRRHAILLNVSDLPSDDLSREIDRLWARVGSTSSESTLSSPSVNLVGSGGDVAWETVSLLKRQHRLSEANWRQTMEASEETLRLLRARLQAAEAELSELRGRSESDGERLMIETLDARQKIEAAQKAIALAEARHTEERRVLEAAMQNLRERLAAETSRARTAEQAAKCSGNWTDNC